MIDISGFEAPGGSLYVTWKVDGNSIGSSHTPIRLQHVGADGYTVDGDVYQLIDRDAADGPLVEAPSLVYWDGYVFRCCQRKTVTDVIAQVVLPVLLVEPLQHDVL